MLTIARARLSADSTKLEDVKVLLNAEGIGGKIIQARDGTLLISSSIPAGVGILSADWPQPQQLDSLMGKMLRINTDGSIPKDNPFVGRPNARGEIYALGIRDDQGLAFHPRTGRLWASEHGPRGGDEINVIQKGKNYGFPVIGYGHDYNGAAINKDRTSQAGMEQPAVLLDAGHRAGRHQLLQRQAVSRVERRPVRRGARQQASRASRAAGRSRNW